MDGWMDGSCPTGRAGDVLHPRTPKDLPLNRAQRRGLSVPKIPTRNHPPLTYAKSATSTPWASSGIPGLLHVLYNLAYACRPLHHGQEVLKQEVLNEMVIDRGSSSFLTNIECYEKGRYITRVQADGIMLATPTGACACVCTCACPWCVRVCMSTGAGRWGHAHICVRAMGRGLGVMRIKGRGGFVGGWGDRGSSMSERVRRGSIYYVDHVLCPKSMHQYSF